MQKILIRKNYSHVYYNGSVKNSFIQLLKNSELELFVQKMRIKQVSVSYSYDEVYPSAPPLPENNPDIELHDSISGQVQNNLENCAKLSQQQKHQQEKDDDKDSEFIVHKIHPFDSLMSLAIKYNTTEQDIMQTNKMINSDLGYYSFKEIYIPKHSGANLQIEQIDHAKLERQKQAHQIRAFQSATKETNDEICHYYLSSNNWNFSKAIEEHRLDLEWEKNNHKRCK